MLEDAAGIRRVFFVKHFSLKKASKFPVFIWGFSLLSAGDIYASLRMSAIVNKKVQLLSEKIPHLLFLLI